MTDPVNIADTIIAKSDQLNADDLMGGAITIEIARVSGASDRDQPINIHYVGDNNKPWKPCKSMRRVIVKAWGVDTSTYVGRRVTLYRDPKVKWGGMEVGGIRISHMSHIEGFKMALTATRGSKKLYEVKPLPDSAPPAQPEQAEDLSKSADEIKAEIAGAASMDDFEKVWRAVMPDVKILRRIDETAYNDILAAKEAKKQDLLGLSDDEGEEDIPI